MPGAGALKSEDAATHSLTLEAAVIGRYLIGQPIDAVSVDRYVRAIRGGAAPLDPDDGRLLERAIRHPWLLGFIDGAAALRRTQASLRRRVLLMFAILETSPRYCDRFLPEPVSWLHAFIVVGAVVRAAVKAAVGVVIVRFL